MVGYLGTYLEVSVEVSLFFFFDFGKEVSSTDAGNECPDPQSNVLLRANELTVMLPFFRTLPGGGVLLVSFHYIQHVIWSDVWLQEPLRVSDTWPGRCRSL